MPTLRFHLFGGVVPRLTPRNLPDNNAQQAINTKLTSGALQPWWKGQLLATLPRLDFRSAYRFALDGVQHIVGFRRRTLITKALLTNDSFERVYLSDDSGFYVTTKADLRDGKEPVLVGAPKPGFAGVRIVVTGGAAAYTETRVYAATLVTKFGEESAPTLLESTAGSSEGKWEIFNLSSVGYNPAKYPQVTHLRLYRTLTSASGVDYRQVHEFPIGAVPEVYIDDRKAVDLTAAYALQTLSWSPPPDGLHGVIPIAGGYLAGFVGRTVYFSHPYYPHAWPEDYQLAVDDEIVALGTYANTLVIATVGRPAIAMGTDPGAMTLAKSEEAAPCLSPESLVSTSASVIYASDTGLVSISDQTGFSTITDPYIKGDEWRQRYKPEAIRAVLHEGQYIGLYANQLGFVFSPSDPFSALTELQQMGVRAIAKDDVLGHTLLLLGGGRVERFDGDYANPMTYNWRSKPYLVPKPVNFGGLQLRAAFGQLTTVSQPPLPLPPSPDGYAINEPDINDELAVSTEGPIRTGNDHLDGVLVRVYGDGKLRWEQLVRSEAPVRLPSGYKAVEWEIEMSGQIPVVSATLASTFKALEATP